MRIDNIVICYLFRTNGSLLRLWSESGGYVEDSRHHSNKLGQVKTWYIYIPPIYMEPSSAHIAISNIPLPNIVFQLGSRFEVPIQQRGEESV